MTFARIANARASGPHTAMTPTGAHAIFEINETMLARI